MKLRTWMKQKGACAEATEWVGDRTPRQAWAECERGDWMLWALARTSIDRREVVRICCDVALSVLHLTDDSRAAAAIDAAEGWCAGEVSIEEVRRAAAAAAANAAVDAAAYAADAAAYAANAANAAAYAANAAADAANAAAAYAAARTDSLRDIADLVRARVDAGWFARLIEEGGR